LGRGPESLERAAGGGGARGVKVGGGGVVPCFLGYPIPSHIQFLASFSYVFMDSCEHGYYILC